MQTYIRKTKVKKVFYHQVQLRPALFLDTAKKILHIFIQCRKIYEHDVQFYFLTSLTVIVFSTIMSISMPAEGAAPTVKCKKSCKAKCKFLNFKQAF